MNIITKEGKDKLQKELEYLLTIERNQAINNLSESRESCDPGENTQYLNAKEECIKIQNRINKINDILLNSKIIELSDINTDKVSLLTKVKVLNMSNNLEMIFNIVPESEIDIKNYKISIKSPIGSGLFGKKVNDICDIKIPSGNLKYKILDITVYDI